MSDSVRPHRRQPTRPRRPWDCPGKNTGVGCHFLLQCTKVKSESEVARSCPTLSDPMDCSPPGSSVHGIFQARVLEWGAIAFSLGPAFRLIVIWVEHNLVAFSSVCVCVCVYLFEMTGLGHGSWERSYSIFLFSKWAWVLHRWGWLKSWVLAMGCLSPLPGTCLYWVKEPLKHVGIPSLYQLPGQHLVYWILRLIFFNRIFLVEEMRNWKVVMVCFCENSRVFDGTKEQDVACEMTELGRWTFSEIDVVIGSMFLKSSQSPMVLLLGLGLLALQHEGLLT